MGKTQRRISKEVDAVEDCLVSGGMASPLNIMEQTIKRVK